MNWADATTLGETLRTRRDGARAGFVRLVSRLKSRPEPRATSRTASDLLPRLLSRLPNLAVPSRLPGLPRLSGLADLAQRLREGPRRRETPVLPRRSRLRLLASWRGFASVRVGRNLVALTVLLALASGFSSDRAPNGVVASASALSLGERSRGAALRQAVDPIAGAFAAVGMGTAEQPRLRATLDDSFVLVAAASRGHEGIFEGLRVVELTEEAASIGGGDGLAAGIALGDVDDGLVADLLSGRPRAKPAVPGPRVQLASLEPADGVAPILRRKSLDLDLANGPPRKYPLGSAPYLELIAREAKANDVPLWVALGVVWVESKFNPKLRGRHGVLGMMQVMPSTARYLGYKGSNEQLLDPETNVVWGMKELGKGYRLSDGNLCLTVAKYTGGFMTNRVRPAAQRYCNEVRRVTGMI